MRTQNLIVTVNGNIDCLGFRSSLQLLLGEKIFGTQRLCSEILDPLKAPMDSVTLTGNWISHLFCDENSPNSTCEGLLYNFLKILTIQQGSIQVVEKLLSITNPVSIIVMNTSAVGVVWHQATGSGVKPCLPKQFYPHSVEQSFHPCFVSGMVPLSSESCKLPLPETSCWALSCPFIGGWLCSTNLQALKLLHLVNPAEDWKVLNKSLECFNFEEFFCKRNKQD